MHFQHKFDNRNRGIISLTVCSSTAVESLIYYVVIATLPVGVPLAGYNHDERRVPHWPLGEETKYTTVSCVYVIGSHDPRGMTCAEKFYTLL